MQNGFTFINEVEVQSAILTTPKSFLTRKKQEKYKVMKTGALGMASYPVSIG